MKKNLLVLIFLSFSFLLHAQDIDKVTALQLVTKNIAAIGLTNEDISNLAVSDAYTDRSAGIDLVYLRQTYKGVPVYNELQVLAFKNGALVSNAGGRIRNIGMITSNINAAPSITAAAAVRTAMAEKNIFSNELLSGNAIVPGGKLNFGKLGIAQVDVTAELMWVPLEDGKKVMLAWQVYLVPTSTADYWMIRVDAHANKIIDENNLTVYCNWSDPAKEIIPYEVAIKRQYEQQTSALKDIKLFDVQYNDPGQQTAGNPSIINSASYRVVPFPAESPKHPGGTPALVTDPWNAAPGNATSLKWHSNGTSDFGLSRSNNVWAKEDHVSNNGSGSPATSTTPTDPLTFNFVPNFAVSPTQTTPVQNQQFNITNLFYWVNTYHDLLYQYGFDEPAGNFQGNNQGRGGQGNDFVYADAQDGNFMDVNHQNNANFATPADGGNGRMQMYLWDTAALCMINAPAAIAGSDWAIESAFSNQNKLIVHGPVTGDVIYYNDNAAGTTHEACVPPANTLTGKIALIDRGNCTFTIKVKAAQVAGAIGVIVVNNVAGLLTMAGLDNTITIPAVVISQADGLLIKNQLAASVNVNVTLSANYMDGDVDNGVICHEHTHGLSNRLTGGPSVPGCLANAENGGEGWSDYYSLMLTQDWANSNLNTGFDVPRAVGTYAAGQFPTGPGIRSQRYSTNFTVNNLVYAPSIAAESHARGELWCATLWDMTWNIINQVGTINPNLFDATNGGGNTIALKLVTQGMKLQPCSPGFIDARNAIIQADQVLYGGIHACAIREAFRRRGMGDNAVQGSSNSVTDQVADFTMNCVSCTNVVVAAQPVATTACTGGTATFSVTVNGTTPAYQWQVSVGGGPFADISGATSATLTLTNVTAGMSTNQYQVVISNTCPSTITSTAVLLTVTDPAGITTQPVNATICAGNNISFTVTATGNSNVYQWQVSTGGPFTDITGATTATITLTGVTAAMNNNQYHLVILSCGPTGLNSNNVTLTVNDPVSISSQPQNITACVGTDATISTVAGGTGNTYQWQVSTGGGPFTDIPGATSSSLTVTAVTAGMNNNVYHVIITNACTPAGTTSTGATLTVTNAASISTQPVNTTVCAGSNGSITATASGSSYQWQVSTGGPFTDIPGATTTTLTLTGVTASMNNNQYQLVIGSCGSSSITSTPVTLTVTVPATITTQPANAVSTCTGTDVTFTVTASGNSPTYQWQVSVGGGPFTDISGATTATLLLNAVTVAMNGNQYQVVLANSCTTGLVSNTGTLTVTAASSITTQPVNAVVCEAATASFSVETANAPGASYQWQVSTGGPFTDITGATNSTLTIPAVSNAMNNNSYHVLITACGSLTSVDAVLSVNPLPIVTITASPYINITSDLTTTLTATSIPPSTVFSWYKDAVLIPAATGSSLTVAHNDIGEYTASVTEPGGCTGGSAVLLIGDSTVNHAFIYSNPNNGHFYVTYSGTQNTSSTRYITMFDAKGAKVYQKVFVTVLAYDKMEVHAEFLSKGTYAVILSDVNGKVLSKGRVMISK